MPITSLELQGKQESSFYRNYTRLASIWEDFSSQYGGQSEGKYNAYFIEAFLQIPVPAGMLEIKGSSRMESVTANVIPVDSAIVKQTTFQIKLAKGASPVFKIKKKPLISLFSPGYTPLDGNKNLVSKTQNETQFRSMMASLPFKGDVLKEGISNFEYNPKTGYLTLHTFRFLETKDELKRIMDAMNYVAGQIN